jgi:hypothetical protein
MKGGHFELYESYHSVVLQPTQQSLETLLPIIIFQAPTYKRVNVFERLQRSNSASLNLRRSPDISYDPDEPNNVFIESARHKDRQSNRGSQLMDTLLRPPDKFFPFKNDGYDLMIAPYTSEREGVTNEYINNHRTHDTGIVRLFTQEGLETILAKNDSSYRRWPVIYLSLTDEFHCRLKVSRSYFPHILFTILDSQGHLKHELVSGSDVVLENGDILELYPSPEFRYEVVEKKIEPKYEIQVTRNSDATTLAKLPVQENASYTVQLNDTVSLSFQIHPESITCRPSAQLLIDDDLTIFKGTKDMPKAFSLYSLDQEEFRIEVVNLQKTKKTGNKIVRIHPERRVQVYTKTPSILDGQYHEFFIQHIPDWYERFLAPRDFLTFQKIREGDKHNYHLLNTFASNRDWPRFFRLLRQRRAIMNHRQPEQDEDTTISYPIPTQHDRARNYHNELVTARNFHNKHPTQLPKLWNQSQSEDNVVEEEEDNSENAKEMDTRMFDMDFGGGSRRSYRLKSRRRPRKHYMVT